MACRSSRRISPTLPTPLRVRAKPTLRRTNRPARTDPLAVARTPLAAARVPRAVTEMILPTSRSTGMPFILAYRLALRGRAGHRPAAVGACVMRQTLSRDGQDGLERGGIGDEGEARLRLRG